MMILIRIKKNGDNYDHEGSNDINYAFACVIKRRSWLTQACGRSQFESGEQEYSVCSLLLCLPHVWGRYWAIFCRTALGVHTHTVAYRHTYLNA